MPLAGHSQKSVRQDAEHSRRDADAPPQELPVGKICGGAGDSGLTTGFLAVASTVLLGLGWWGPGPPSHAERCNSAKAGLKQQAKSPATKSPG